MRASRLVAALVAAGGSALALVPAAGAHRVPCLPGGHGPRCHVQRAHVVRINDGDTIDVHLEGRHAGPAKVRLTGINAMELHRYSEYPNRRRGDCHGVQAADRLEQLLRAGGMRVRLVSQHIGDVSGHRKRLRRQVSTKVAGHWIDVDRVLVGEGMALWLPNRREHAWNRAYHALAVTAAHRRANLWDPVGCGPGPSPFASLRVRVHSDAPGADGEHLNGESVRIRNRDGRHAVGIGGWWVRDSTLTRFTFPAGTTIPPGGHVTVHVGTGQAHGGRFFWGQSAPIFENASPKRPWTGDGAYLFDPRGNLRAYDIY